MNSSPTSPVSPMISSSNDPSSISLSTSISNNSITSESSLDSHHSSPSSSSSSSSNYGTKTPSGNARIYNCTLCQRAFTREEHLTRHTLSTHNKLKPFTCGICSRPFSRRDLLLRHAKNLHQGSEVAVSRIRKSYKHSKDRNNNNDNSKMINNNNHNEDSKSESDESDTNDIGVDYNDDDIKGNYHVSPILAKPIISKVIKPSVVVVGSSSSSNIVTSKNQTTTPRQIDDYETPEKKRLKISVNMLVS